MIQKILGVIYIISVLTSISAATGSCTELPKIPNADIKTQDSGNLTVTCKKGFFGMQDKEELLCQNGNWTESKINCSSKQDDRISSGVDPLPAVEFCSVLPNITNANVELRTDGLVEVTCQEGYIGIIDKEEIICENETWTESEINCTAATQLCAPKPNIKHANIKEKQGILEVTCLDGYKGTKDKEELTCQNEKWTESEINCTDLCAILPNITNAEVKLKKSGVAKVTCFKEYSAAIDEQEISCTNGIWEDLKTKCIAPNENKLSEDQSLKFSLFLLHTALHKNYLVCIFITSNQTCDCILGKVIFKEEKGKKIVSHNDKTIFNITQEECATNCRLQKWCVSFEYNNQYNICHLSKTAKYMLSPLLFVNKDSVTYFEKVCQNDAIEK